MAVHRDHRTLRFASYNIRKAKGLDQRRDPQRILDVINGLEADIVALQEADRRLGDRPSALPRRMIETETEFEVLTVARNEVSLGWHGNAVLMRKGLKAKSVTRIDLPGLEPRGAVRFDLDLPGRVAVVGTHLGLMRRHRRRQLDVLTQVIAPGTNAIILGDLNEWSQRRGLEPLSAAFTVISPGHSFHAARPVAALDRFAYMGDIAVTNAGVEQGKLARRASDHLPIWADIRLPRKSVAS